MSVLDSRARVRARVGGRGRVGLLEVGSPKRQTSWPVPRVRVGLGLGGGLGLESGLGVGVGVGLRLGKPAGAVAPLVEARAAHVHARAPAERAGGGGEGGDRWSDVHAQGERCPVLLAVERHTEG